MEIQTIRHGTVIVTLGGFKVLVDPMLSDCGKMAPVPEVPNQKPNPLVPLPIALNNILNVDSVLITHIHRDHFDDAAAELIPKYLQIFCQPGDREKLRAKGFENVLEIKESLNWNGITFDRVEGRHGHGVTAAAMGNVSGFMLRKSGEPSLYITGDTVWCGRVERAMAKYRPDVIVCFAGEARFAYGKPITMDSEDLQTVCSKAPGAKVVAVHMEAWNHCRLSRSELREFADRTGFGKQLYIPHDGEILNF